MVGLVSTTVVSAIQLNTSIDTSVNVNFHKNE